MEEITVLRQHLEELERVLDYTLGLLTSQDLAAEYKKMSTAPSQSRLTRSVEGQLQRVRGYLDDSNQENG
jgi:hypothetical protein